MTTTNDLLQDEFDLLWFNDNEEVLFTPVRVKRAILPAGVFAYDVREGDDGIFCSIEPIVMVNHAGTILSKHPIELGENNCLMIEEYGLDSGTTLEDWLGLPKEYPRYYGDDDGRAE